MTVETKKSDRAIVLRAVLKSLRNATKSLHQAQALGVESIAAQHVVTAGLDLAYAVAMLAGCVLNEELHSGNLRVLAQELVDGGVEE